MARCPLWSPGRDAGEEATPERPELPAFPEELTHWHHFCHSFIGVSLTPNKLHHTSDNEQLLTPKVPSDTFKALSQAPAASARSLGNRDTFSRWCVFSGVSCRRNHTPSPFSVCPAPFPEHGHAAAVRSAAHVSCTALSIGVCAVRLPGHLWLDPRVTSIFGCYKQSCYDYTCTENNFNVS